MAPPVRTFFSMDRRSSCATTWRVRPEREDDVRAALRDKRIEAGPWFVLGDNLLVGGEALVRNLLAGRAVLAELGGARRASSTAPMPSDTPRHSRASPPVSVPRSACVWRGYGGAPWPPGDSARWRERDGSLVLLHHLAPDGYELGANLPHDAPRARANWERLRAILEPRATLGIALLPNGADHHAVQSHRGEAISALADAAAPVRVVEGSLQSLADALGAAAAAAPLPVVQWRVAPLARLRLVAAGDVRLARRTEAAQRAPPSDCSPITPSRNGARLVERRPLAPARDARALAHAALVPPARHALRLLDRRRRRCDGSPPRRGPSRRSARRDARRARAAGLDDPAAARAARRRMAAGARRAKRAPALARRHRGVGGGRAGRRRPGGPGERQRSRSRAARPAVAARGSSVRGAGTLARAAIRARRIAAPLPAQRTRRTSTSCWPGSHRWMVWRWTSSRSRKEGERALRARSSVGEDREHRAVQRVTATSRTLDNGICRVSVEPSGELTFVAPDGRILHDVIGLEVIGDRGDLYTHSPIPGTHAVGRITAHRIVRRGPLRATLRLTMKATLPARTLHTATGVRRRQRAMAINVMADIELDAGASRLAIHVHGDHRADDCRVRLLLRTGIAHPRVFADAAFGEVERDRAIGRRCRGTWARRTKPSSAPRRCTATSRSPTQRAARADQRRTRRVRSAPADGTLAVTLVRAVGELARGDLPERPGFAGWPVATPGAQSHGPVRGALRPPRPRRRRRRRSARWCAMPPRTSSSRSPGPPGARRSTRPAVRPDCS